MVPVGVLARTLELIIEINSHSHSYCIFTQPFCYSGICCSVPKRCHATPRRYRGYHGTIPYISDNAVQYVPVGVLWYVVVVQVRKIIRWYVLVPVVVLRTYYTVFSPNQNWKYSTPPKFSIYQRKSRGQIWGPSEPNSITTNKYFVKQNLSQSHFKEHSVATIIMAPRQCL